MSVLFYLGMFILLFAGVNVLNYIGWGIGLDYVENWKKILPVVYIYVPLVIYKNFMVKNKREDYLKNKYEYRLLMILFILICFMIVMEHDNVYGMIINSLLLPILVSIVIPKDRYSICNYNIARNIRKIIYSFFIIECGIAIIERLYLINIFPLAGSGISMLENGFKGSFRSTALHNHPLQNALCVSIIMSFVLVTYNKEIKKMLIIILGYISILCFNTRSSIVGWVLLFIIYIIYNIFFEKKKTALAKYGLVVFAGIIVVFIIWIITTFSLGDRIINLGLFDNSSAYERIKIWDIFRVYSIMDFLLGVSSSTAKTITSSVGVVVVENYWLVFLLRFGVIFLLFIAIYYAGLIKKLLNGYSSFQKYFVIICFLFISSTNNSLASAAPALVLFIVCCYIFNPQIKINTYLNK